MARWRKLGIIAGGGGLPARIANACTERGDVFHLIKLSGFADGGLDGYDGDDASIGEAGKILRILKNQNCDAVVFAGIVRRPDFKSLKVDWSGAALLPKVVAAAARGDGALLGVLVETVEAEGMIVIGAEEAMEDLTAREGLLGMVQPSERDHSDMAKAAAIVRALGPFDVGQGAVVAEGLVLAIEAAEGTDAMLERCAALPFQRDGAARSGVLVKQPKPGQELRIDLPVIGPETIKRADAAGLAGVAVEAGKAIIIDKEELVGLADRLGLFVYGFRDEEVR